MNEQGASGLPTVLIIIAVAMIGGFLVWLNRSATALDAEREAARIAAEEAAEAGRVYTIDLIALSADPAGNVGEGAGLDSVGIVQSLGRGVFLVRLAAAEEGAEGDPYPVLMSSDLIQRDVQLYGGDWVRLRGHIYSLNDSIRSAWVESGAVEGASSENIPAVTSFLLADSLEIY